MVQHFHHTFGDWHKIFPFCWLDRLQPFQSYHGVSLRHICFQFSWIPHPQICFPQWKLSNGQQVDEIPSFHFTWNPSYVTSRPVSIFLFSDRIVFPPALAFIAMTIGYYTFYKLIQFENDQLTFAFWIGFVVGYLIYDLIHYCLHHIDTSKNKRGWFHKLQQYHNQHHFGGEQKGFGVSSPFWDYVFKTTMSKRSVHWICLHSIYYFFILFLVFLPNYKPESSGLQD